MKPLDTPTVTSRSKSTPAEIVSRGAKPIRRYKRLAYTALGLSLIAGGVYAMLPNEAETEAVAPALPVVTVELAQQKLLSHVEEFTGRVDATETVHLSPQVSGRIERVAFSAGDIVEEGQVLFEIDAQTFQANFDAAQAALTEAQAHAEQTAKQAERAQNLFAAKAISRDEFEVRRSSAQQATARTQLAQAALQNAAIELERTQVKAPITGRISRALVTRGNLVSGNANAATPLATIVASGKAYVYVDVDESTALSFRQRLADGAIKTNANGQVPVEMRLSNEDHFNRIGYVESLDNQVNTSTGSLQLRLAFEDPNGELLPGLFARVRLPLSKEENRVLVRERSIGTDQSQKFVLTVDANSQVQYRSVTLGSARGALREIQTGLQPGDRVIVNGLQRVRPGVFVNSVLSTETASAIASR